MYSVAVINHIVIEHQQHCPDDQYIVLTSTASGWCVFFDDRHGAFRCGYFLRKTTTFCIFWSKVLISNRQAYQKRTWNIFCFLLKVFYNSLLISHVISIMFTIKQSWWSMVKGECNPAFKLVPCMGYRIFHGFSPPSPFIVFIFRI